MENIRRNIKLFWVSHGGPIKLAILIIAGIILVLRGLDQLAIENKAKKDKIRNQQIAQEVKINGEDKDLVNQFVEFCKDGYVLKAYDLLSQKCKDEKYPTLQEFEENYYKKIFIKVITNNHITVESTKRLDIKVEYDSLENLYKVTFMQPIIQTGKIDDKNSIVDYYKIEKEGSNKRIYIET